MFNNDNKAFIGNKDLVWKTWYLFRNDLGAPDYRLRIYKKKGNQNDEIRARTIILQFLCDFPKVVICYM